MNFKMYLKTVLMTAVAVIGLSACDDNDDEQPVAPPSSEETLTFKVSVEPGVEGSVTTVSIRPTTDDVEYYANVWSKEKVGAVSGSELTKMILEAEDLADRTYWGEELLSFEGLKAGTYYVVIMGVENGKAVDKPKKKPFMVKEKEPATLTLTREEVTSSSVGYTVTPSDPNETYIVSAILKSEFDEYETTTAFMGGDVDYWKANGGLAAMLKKGEYSATIPGLEENTEYVLYAYYCDAEGMVTTGLVTSVFTTKTSQPTPPPPAGDAPTINPLIEMYDSGEYQGAAPGGVVFEITVNPSSNAAHYYIALGKPELGQIPDDQLINELLQGGEGIYQDKPTLALGVWNVGDEFVLIGVAVDASGNAGPLYKIQDTAEVGKTIGDPNPPTPPSGDGPKVSAEFKWVDAATIDPSYAGLFALEVKLTTDGAHTYSACFQPQTADATDSQIIAALTSGGDGVSFDPQGGMELWRTFTPGEETLYAVVATDAAGKPGPLLRQMLVAGEDIDDPNPPTPSGDYAKYLGYWTVSGVDAETNQPVTYEITIEQNVAGQSYKVWGLTNTVLDYDLGAPVIWDFVDGKLSLSNKYDLGATFTSGNLSGPLGFCGFAPSGDGYTRFTNEGTPIATGEISTDGKSIALEWATVESSDGAKFTMASWSYGFTNTANGKFYTWKSDPLMLNITIAQVPEEEPSDAYKAYLGNWTLTGQDEGGSDVAYELNIAQERANKTYKVSGWSNAIGMEYPLTMTFDPATNNVSIKAQPLGAISGSVVGDASLGNGKLSFLGIVEFNGNMSRVTGSYDALIGTLSNNRITFTGGRVALSGGGEYDVVAARYFGVWEAADAIYTFDGNSYPFAPMTAVKSTAGGAKKQSKAFTPASFQRVPEMMLSNVLDAANVYASFDTHTAVAASPSKVMNICTNRRISAAAKKSAVVLREQLATPNFTPCRK